MSRRASVGSIADPNKCDLCRLAHPSRGSRDICEVASNFLRMDRSRAAAETEIVDVAGANDEICFGSILGALIFEGPVV
jgi:hypothetical protein